MKSQKQRRLCIDPVHEDVKAGLKANGLCWVQAVIECVGRPSTISQAIEIAGPKGTVMMFGLTGPDEQIAVNPFEIFRKELELKSSYINPYTQQRALDLIDSGRIDVSSMVAEVCGLDKLKDILSGQELRAKGSISSHRESHRKSDGQAWFLLLGSYQLYKILPASQYLISICAGHQDRVPCLFFMILCVISSCG